MKVTMGIVAVVVALLAGSCGNPEPSAPAARSFSSLPTYTPRPATPTSDALYKAYSTALDDLDSALDDLHKARSTALDNLDAAPEVALNAVQEAGNCDVPIDALTNDPRDMLTAIVGIPADPRLKVAREAPKTIAHDLAAARVAHLTSRTAIEDARSALVRAQLTGEPTPDYSGS